MRFFKCLHCGNIITFLKDAGVPVMCCGEKMKELKAGTTDGALEKHVPVVTIEGSKVTVVVGEVEHPMLEEHYIEWIILETKNGFQKVNLAPGMTPKAEFVLADGDEAVTAYEYCNLHGLWATEISKS
jgi:superoxide reductase